MCVSGASGEEALVAAREREHAAAAAVVLSRPVAQGAEASLVWLGQLPQVDRSWRPRGYRLVPASEPSYRSMWTESERV